MEIILNYSGWTHHNARFLESGGSRQKTVREGDVAVAAVAEFLCCWP